MSLRLGPVRVTGPNLTPSSTPVALTPRLVAQGVTLAPRGLSLGTPSAVGGLSPHFPGQADPSGAYEAASIARTLSALIERKAERDELNFDYAALIDAAML